jgi:hypothetical protein
MSDHPGRKPSERGRAGVEVPGDLPRRIVPAARIVHFVSKDNGKTTEEARETAGDLARLNHDLTVLNYVGMATRPGVSYFATYLEFTFYQPCFPDLNARFQYRFIEWHDMPWVMITIPFADRPKAEEAAKKAELVIIHGMPGVIDSEGVAFFPINNRNTFNLESIEGAPIYRGQLNGRLALALEREECDELLARYERGYWESLARLRGTS